MGGCDKGWNTTNSVLALNLAEPNKQWREGTPLNQKRSGHAAVVSNGGVYVMGGYFEHVCLNCIERIDVKDLMQSPLPASNKYERHWTTLNCRLSSGRHGCCALSVHNRYIVVMGGYCNHRYWSSVDIVDTKNHIVTAGPSMTVPRSFCSSAVVGHRIFVVGGHNDEHVNLASVEYVDFAEPCDSDQIKEETGSTFIPLSSAWITHSDLVLSNPRDSCAMVPVGSCLVVAGGWRISTVEVLDTRRNRVWNLPPLTNNCRSGCSMLTAANQVAVIGGLYNPTCATLPLMDRNSWCFRRLCEQQLSGWYHLREGMGISSFSTSTSKSE